MYTCIHVYIYTSIHIYIYTYIHIYIYACIYVCMYTCMHIYIYTHTYDMCTYLHFIIYIYIYIYMPIMRVPAALMVHPVAIWGFKIPRGLSFELGGSPRLARHKCRIIYIYIYICSAEEMLSMGPCGGRSMGLIWRRPAGVILTAGSCAWTARPYIAVFCELSIRHEIKGPW